MTRLLLFAFAMSTIIFYTGCSEEEPEGTPSLIGEWETTGLDGNVEVEAVVLGFPITTKSTITGSNFDYDVTVTETQIMTSGSYDVTVTTNVPGQGSQSETTSVTDANGTASYTLDGDVLTLDGAVFDLGVDDISTDFVNAEQELSVDFNGENEVTLGQNQTIEVDDPLSGGKITVTIVTTTKMTRK